MGNTDHSIPGHGGLQQLPRDLIASRELLVDLVRKDLRVRYRYAALGFVWAVLEPLAYMVVLTILFEKVLAPRGTTDMFGPGIPFASGLLCGLVFWQFTNQSLSAATASLIDNQHLVRKVAFTREIIPLAATGYPCVALLIGIAVLGSVHVALGGVLHATALWILPIFLIQATGTIGLGLTVSAAQVRFRDVGYLVSVTLILGFYASPVFYDLDWVLAAASSGKLPDWVVQLYLLNPMTTLLEAYRMAILEGNTPDAWLLVWPTCFSFMTLIVGFVFFRRCSPTLSDYL